MRWPGRRHCSRASKRAPPGHLPELEGAAVTWQCGQQQPYALAALVIAHDVLVHSAGHQVHFVSPLDAERRAREGKLEPPPEWMRRRLGG
jgi:hypothetical protein